MGATVSLPEPYSCFPLLSVGDVDSMIHKHRDEGENDFMISTAALSKLLGVASDTVQAVQLVDRALRSAERDSAPAASLDRRKARAAPTRTSEQPEPA